MKATACQRHDVRGSSAQDQQFYFRRSTLLRVDDDIDPEIGIAEDTLVPGNLAGPNPGDGSLAAEPVGQHARDEIDFINRRHGHKQDRIGRTGLLENSG